MALDLRGINLADKNILTFATKKDAKRHRLPYLCYITEHELGRAIGVGQDTAWFMLHRIRKGMEQQGGDKMDGEIEADETYVGARPPTCTRRGERSSSPGAARIT